MYRFPITYLNSNNGCGLLAFGDGENILASDANCISKLEIFIKSNPGKYIFGYLSYDLKNEIENLSSNNLDGVEFPELYFWIPKYVVDLKNENFNFVQGNKDKESLDFLNYFLDIFGFEK